MKRIGEIRQKREAQFIKNRCALPPMCLAYAIVTICCRLRAGRSLALQKEMVSMEKHIHLIKAPLGTLTQSALARCVMINVPPPAVSKKQLRQKAIARQQRKTDVEMA